MKKFFSWIGIMTILCVSFFYTEKITNVVKEYDEIMIQIKEKNKNYKIDPINALIKEDTIVPGIHGREINEDKSYSKMKQYGKYNRNLLVYKNKYPEISLKNNNNYYIISGNPNKMMISIIFEIYNNDDISEIIRILEKNNSYGNFFINDAWLENNSNQMIELIKKGHNVGGISNKNDYTYSTYPWIDSLIKNVGKQKTNFCYLNQKNDKSLRLCSSYKNYTILTNKIITKDYLKNVKDDLTAGSILVFDVSNTLKEELDTVIKYIKSKGLTIVSLEEHLKE